jgi:dTDP-4-amino-4,6-dideoxygalactose transaminase
MPVHIYGRLANMAEINRIAKKYKLKVVEDACEVHGASTGPADLTCYSFYKNKIVHAEEGGIIVTDNEALYKDMQDLKSMAFGDTHDYFHKRIGFNYRMPDQQAGMALESLKNVTKNLEKRRMVESYYDKYLPPEIRRKGGRAVVWVYDIEHHQKDYKVKQLFNRGARHFFRPISSFPMYGGVARGKISKLMSENGMYLPVTPEMTEKEVIEICKEL